MDGLRFATCRSDEEPAATLLGAMVAEIGALYDGLELDGADMPSASPADLGPPGGTFVVGWASAPSDPSAGPEPACCGGIKPLGGGVCEIKRMFVVPHLRGFGVARLLLGELEEQARRLGHRTARLDTGPRQAGARHLYKSAGYAPIGNFNANPVATFWGEKSL